MSEPTEREKELFHDLETVIDIEGIEAKDIPLFLIREYAREYTTAALAEVRALLEPLVELEAKATPGPYTYCNEKTGGCKCGFISSQHPDYGNAPPVATTQTDPDEDFYKIPLEVIQNNAKHITALLNVLPALFAAVGLKGEKE